MSSLAEREKKILLGVARRALERAAQAGETLEASSLPADEIFTQTGGAFVTLRLRSRLRGCIGQLASEIPLIEVVTYCARTAALEDPRFQPVRAEQVSEIDIELSILSPLKDAAPSEIEPGKHGLFITRGQQRGLLLPQVAVEFRWTAERFIEEACVKAGLESEAWKDPATRLQVFTADVFSESKLEAERSSGS